MRSARHEREEPQPPHPQPGSGAAVLHRRRFAVPLPGQRVDGVVDLPKPANGLPAGPTHANDLDAGDPTHRHLITAIEQAAHGIHVQRIPVYAEVVEQLWNDEPATVWHTAEHLQVAGLMSTTSSGAHTGKPETPTAGHPDLPGAGHLAHPPFCPVSPQT